MEHPNTYDDEVEYMGSTWTSGGSPGRSPGHSGERLRASRESVSDVVMWLRESGGSDGRHGATSSPSKHLSVPVSKKKIQAAIERSKKVYTDCLRKSLFYADADTTALLPILQESLRLGSGRVEASDLRLGSVPGEILICLGHLWQSLSLANNRIRTLPSELGELRYLRRLVLSGNRMERLPSVIGTLRSLEWLYLANCGLRALPDALGRLNRLQGLALTGNVLDFLPPRITSLGALVALDLSYNQFQRIPFELAALESLRELNLLGNPFSQSEEETLAASSSNVAAVVRPFLRSRAELEHEESFDSFADVERRRDEQRRDEQPRRDARGDRRRASDATRDSSSEQRHAHFHESSANDAGGATSSNGRSPRSAGPPLGTSASSLCSSTTADTHSSVASSDSGPMQLLRRLESRLDQLIADRQMFCHVNSSLEAELAAADGMLPSDRLRDVVEAIQAELDAKTGVRSGRPPSEPPRGAPSAARSAAPAAATQTSRRGSGQTPTKQTAEKAVQCTLLTSDPASAAMLADIEAPREHYGDVAQQSRASGRPRSQSKPLGYTVLPSSRVHSLNDGNSEYLIAAAARAAEEDMMESNGASPRHDPYAFTRSSELDDFDVFVDESRDAPMPGLVAVGKSESWQSEATDLPEVVSTEDAVTIVSAVRELFAQLAERFPNGPIESEGAPSAGAVRAADEMQDNLDSLLSLVLDHADSNPEQSDGMASELMATASRLASGNVLSPILEVPPLPSPGTGVSPIVSIVEAAKALSSTLASFCRAVWTPKLSLEEAELLRASRLDSTELGGSSSDSDEADARESSVRDVVSNLMESANVAFGRMDRRMSVDLSKLNTGRRASVAQLSNLKSKWGLAVPAERRGSLMPSMLPTSGSERSGLTSFRLPDRAQSSERRSSPLSASRSSKA